MKTFHYTKYSLLAFQMKQVQPLCPCGPETLRSHHAEHVRSLQMSAVSQSHSESFQTLLKDTPKNTIAEVEHADLLGHGSEIKGLS